MSDPASDLDSLLYRLADGERAVFAEVFRALWPKVRRLSQSLLKNDADAADAAQQALEKVLTRCHEYDRSRPALPWALGIAAWECRTLLRQRSRRRELPAELAPELGTETSTELERRELAQAAVAALGELSGDDQEALMATYWEEAASVSGATLRKRRERALHRLRETFKRLYGLD